MPLSINYDSPRELRAFLDERGLGMRKKLGQNFLIDPNTRSKLINALDIMRGSRIWEIGPGLGAMTGELLLRGGQVSAFEIDPAFSGVLRELYGGNSAFRLIEGDVFRTWPEEDREDGMGGSNAGELFLMGNLPYNIAAALIADFIEKRRYFSRMVVTVQREVAQRMCAKPGTADYSSFSVLCSSVYKVFPLSVIKGSCFFPPPRVDSQGVRLELLESGKNMPALFYPMVRSLFSARRKTLRNTLTAFTASVIIKPGHYLNDFYAPVHPAANSGLAAGMADEALSRAGISGNCRAETLDKGEFAVLASTLEGIVCHADEHRGEN